MNCCGSCSLSNQFGDGALAMSGSVNNNDNNRNHANARFPHMSPASQKVAALSSEIDDIFTRKAETRTIQTTNQPSNSNPKQKSRKKKRSETQTAERKRSAPEIVLDPSTTRQSHASTSKTTSHDRPVPSRKKRKLIETKFDQEIFRDSRGTGPRRKTDEGFAIFKEDELGINPEAGGTPLCPFECNCCF